MIGHYLSLRLITWTSATNQLDVFFYFRVHTRWIFLFNSPFIIIWPDKVRYGWFTVAIATSTTFFRLWLLTWQIRKKLTSLPCTYVLTPEYIQLHIYCNFLYLLHIYINYCGTRSISSIICNVQFAGQTKSNHAQYQLVVAEAPTLLWCSVQF